MFLVWLLVPAIVTAQDLGVHPLNKSWIFAEHAEAPTNAGFVTFRKYSVIIAREVDGSMSFDNFRNTQMFHCSLQDDIPSYFNIALPREINLDAVIGSEFVDDFPLRVEVDGNKFSILAEMHDNEVFVDDVGAEPCCHP